MPKISKHKKRANLVLISILAAVILAGALYFLFAGGSRPEKAIVAEAPGWEQSPAPAPQPEPVPPGPEVSAATEEASIPMPAGEPEAASAPVEAPDPCRQTRNRISGFFSHLDGRGYVGLYELEDGSENHFAELSARLFADPPVLVQETESLTTLLKNTTHLYRVLGRSNLFLIKNVLEEESSMVETIMADFYRWSTIAPECSPGESDFDLPLDGLYEYAGFFLNTLGGQSYLFRRSPRIRTLTRYYSVLILDRANEKGINKYGLDIRPAIDSLIGEMEAIQNLEAQEEYLATLQKLKSKYISRYGRL